MAENDSPKDVIETLIETCRDGENGYAHAASFVQDPKLKEYFQQRTAERHKFGNELTQAAKRHGEVEASQTGTAAGALHRAWFEAKADFGAGDHEILSSVEQGEDVAKKNYQEALNTPLPPNLTEIIRRQFQQIQQAHDQVRSWRDQKAA